MFNDLIRLGELKTCHNDKKNVENPIKRVISITKWKNINDNSYRIALPKIITWTLIKLKRKKLPNRSVTYSHCLFIYRYRKTFAIPINHQSETHTKQRNDIY